MKSRHRKLVSTLACLVFVALPDRVRADEFICSFAKGTFLNWKQPSSEWDTHVAVNEPSPLIIHVMASPEAAWQALQANAKKRRDSKSLEGLKPFLAAARLTGYSGFVKSDHNYMARVDVIWVRGVVTFIETTATGNVTSTTVFLNRKTFDGKLAAVHSRHIDMQGGPAVSQYTGACLHH
jgi:hypothetical protein